MFVLDTVSGRVRVAFTDRHSTKRRSTDRHGTDLAGAAGLARLAAALDMRVEDVVVMRQVHGNDVAVVDRSTPRTPMPVADALVTSTPGLALLARAADCVPVALADPAIGIAAVVHSGRQGTAAGVAPATVEVMRAQGAGELEAWIGPRVCGACYEVPAELRAEVAAAEPATWSTTRAGTPALDLAAGVRAQLHRAGVHVHELPDDAPTCTMESPNLFSHRRQGASSGRQGVLVQVLS